MLQDTTNIKTFSRRVNTEAKQSLAAPPATILQKNDDKIPQKQKGVKNGRRTSVIPLPKKAPARQARGKKGDSGIKTAKERNSQISALIRQQLALLKQEFAEIDEYELIEESPEKPKMTQNKPSPAHPRAAGLDLIAEEEEEEEEEGGGANANEAESSPAIVVLVSPHSSASQPPLLDLSASDQSPNGPLDLSAASPSQSISISADSNSKSEVDCGSPSDEISSGPSLSSSDSSHPQTTMVKSPTSDISPSVRSLLNVCGQEASKLSDLPLMSELLARLGDTSKVRKVGEGSYGEAFKVGSHVLKVIPVEGARLVNGWAQKRAEEMTGEVLVALTLSGLAYDSKKKEFNMCPCFVETSQAAVVRGPYDGHLVKAWHEWDELHTSENEAVDAVDVNATSSSSTEVKSSISSTSATNNDKVNVDRQLYLILAMGDAGQDLEKYELGSRAGQAFKIGKSKLFPVQSQLDEAKSILCQTAFALAIGEAAVEFEHRDLHWGNLLIKSCTDESLGMRIGGMELKVKSNGIRASLIDFTASRLVTSNGQGKVAFCDLEAEEGIFEGPEGEIQFDTYRAMREKTGKRWDDSCLGTNCLWLSYLAETLAAEKILGSSAEANKARKQLRDFKTRCLGYSAAGELAIKDPLFVGLWSA